VTRPDQVWAANITYLPMRRGFLCLVAIMDWHTCKVLAWRILKTLEVDFCVEALTDAIHRFGPPEIMHTDQGSPFTSFAWTDRLRRSGVRISMDGKGRFLPSRGRLAEKRRNQNQSARAESRLIYDKNCPRFGQRPYQVPLGETARLIIPVSSKLLAHSSNLTHSIATGALAHHDEEASGS